MNKILQHDSERFAAFLAKNYARARDWEDPVGYCAWNIAHGFIAAVTDGPDKIVAICTARPVDRPGFGVLPFYFNERGTCLHIDDLVDTSDDPRTILVLRSFFWFRFGPREYVTMFRRTEQSIHCYDYTRFWGKLTRMKRSRIKKRKTQNVIAKSSGCA